MCTYREKSCASINEKAIRGRSFQVYRSKTKYPTMSYRLDRLKYLAIYFFSRRDQCRTYSQRTRLGR